MFERTWHFANGVSTSVSAQQAVVVWHMFNCRVGQFRADLADLLGEARHDEFMNLSLTLNLATNRGSISVNGFPRGGLSGDDIMRIQLAMKADKPVLV